jgi:hypothetical protein
LSGSTWQGCVRLAHASANYVLSETEFSVRQREETQDAASLVV